MTSKQRMWTDNDGGLGTTNRSQRAYSLSKVTERGQIFADSLTDPAGTDFGMDVSLRRTRCKAACATSTFQQEATDVQRRSRNTDKQLLTSLARKCSVPDQFYSFDEFRPMNGHRPVEVMDRSMTPQLRSRAQSEAREISTVRESTKDRVNRIKDNIDQMLHQMDPILNHYSSVRSSLRNVNDHVEQHRMMTNRFVKYDVNEKPPVCPRQRVYELSDRMYASSALGRDRNTEALNEQKEMYNYSPLTTLGYAGNIALKDGNQTSELRGRIRRLLCRSKNNPHYYRY